MMRNGHPQPLVIVGKKHVIYDKVKLKTLYKGSKRNIEQAEKKGEEWNDKTPTTTLLGVSFSYKDYNSEDKVKDIVIVADLDLKEEDYEDFVIEQVKIFERDLRDERISELRNMLSEEDYEMVKASDEYEVE